MLKHVPPTCKQTRPVRASRCSERSTKYFQVKQVLVPSLVTRVDAPAVWACPDRAPAAAGGSRAAHGALHAASAAALVYLARTRTFHGLRLDAGRAGCSVPHLGSAATLPR